MRKHTLTTLCFCTLVLTTCHTGSADIIVTNNRAGFISSLDSTLINENLEGFSGSDVDFENSSVNASSFGSPLSGFDVSHTGDEIVTQFVNGTFTNNEQTGNPGVDIQFLLDLAGVTGAFGSQSNQADSGVIAVTLPGVNAFGFDTFGFNDQGLSFLLDPQTLGVELGVLTTILDSAGNTLEVAIDPTDTFFGVTSTQGDIESITFSAVPTFATSGVEFIAIDNFNRNKLYT